MAPYSMDLRTRVARAWDAGMDAEAVNRTGFIGGLIPREDVPYGQTQQVFPGAA